MGVDDSKSLFPTNYESEKWEYLILIRKVCGDVAIIIEIDIQKISNQILCLPSNLINSSNFNSFD